MEKEAAEMDNRECSPAWAFKSSPKSSVMLSMIFIRRAPSPIPHQLHDNELSAPKPDPGLHQPDTHAASDTVSMQPLSRDRPRSRNEVSPFQVPYLKDFCSFFGNAVRRAEGQS
jgi:hypothetical protein